MNYDVAGKVFLLGEYAALTGDPSLVLSSGPRFELKTAEALATGTTKASFSDASPLGRLIAYASQHGVSVPPFEFVDPHAGAGGFGASTAQFTLMYFHLAETSGWEKSWRGAWRLYRELTSDSPMPPSGADLVSQWCGGLCLFDARRSETEDLWHCLEGAELLIFSATAADSLAKTATHEHLNEASVKDFVSDRNPFFQELRGTITSGISALRESNLRGLGAAMNQAGEILEKAGFEVARTAELRKKLKAMPGVLGAKGAGAMQSDAFIILLERRAAAASEVIVTCEAAGLKLLGDGFTREPGIQRSAS